MGASNMRRISVFCGSAYGNHPVFKNQAIELGKELVAAGLQLVYGGGHVGLMGALADAVLADGGKVTGIIPEDLVTKELAHSGLTELKIVSSIVERKQLMAELGDGFIALPGGYGTLEEFCEMLTWSMLGWHKKPCALLNIDGYYDHLLQFFDTAVQRQFLDISHKTMILVSQSSRDLLAQMKTYKHTAKERWLASTPID